GETSATQTTVDGLLGLRFRLRGIDDTATAAVKGDARMAELIERAAAGAIKIPDDGVQLRFRTRRLSLTADELHELLHEARSRGTSFGAQRDRFRSQLVRRAYDRFTGGVAIEMDEGEFGAELLAEPTARKAIDGLWKSVNAIGLVRSLLTQRTVLA